MKKAEFGQLHEDQSTTEARIKLINELKQDSAVRKLFLDCHIPTEVLQTDTFRIDSWRKARQGCEGCVSLSACCMKQKGMRAGLRYDGILNETIESCAYRDQQDKMEAHWSRYLTVIFPMI